MRPEAQLSSTTLKWEKGICVDLEFESLLVMVVDDDMS